MNKVLFSSWYTHAYIYIYTHTYVYMQPCAGTKVSCAKCHTALSELQEESAYRKQENHWVTVYHILSLDQDSPFLWERNKKINHACIVLYTCKNDWTQLTINIFTTWKNDVNSDETDFASKHAKEVNQITPQKTTTTTSKHKETKTKTTNSAVKHVLISFLISLVFFQS